MAARTIENEADRRMTIMLSTFIPCSAKSVIIGMITATFFPDSVFIAPAMYFLGIAVIVLSGIALKKTAYFSGEVAPFVMELPAYHMPSWKGLMIHMWERSRGFIIKAGTIIFTVCVLIWFLSKFNFALNIVEVEESMLAAIGHSVAWLFAPLGLGDWKGAVAIISAEMAKEQAIGTLAILSGVADPGNDELVMTGIKTMFTPMAAFSFMVLNLFDPPCIVAIATIIREMNSKKWATIAIGYQIVIGYALAMVVYQLGSWFFYGAPFGVGQGVAILLLVLALYFIVRPEPRFRGSVLGLDE
jgi:ferrous iron transport protein B